MSLINNSFDDLLTTDEFKIWRNNTPFLYDMVILFYNINNFFKVISSALEWPSLTVQWLPGIDKNFHLNYTTHEMILGTQTLNEQNYLYIVQVLLPTNDVEFFEYEMNEGDDENEKNCESVKKLFFFLIYKKFSFLWI